MSIRDPRKMPLHTFNTDMVAFNTDMVNSVSDVLSSEYDSDIADIQRNLPTWQASLVLCKSKISTKPPSTNVEN